MSSCLHSGTCPFQVKLARPDTVFALHSGDNVNGISPDDRLPDPERLLSAFFHSAATVNHVRSLLASGFASLPTNGDEDVPWSLPLSHVRSPGLLKAYEEIVHNLSEAMEFMSVVGVDRSGSAGDGGPLESADIFMSHEVCVCDARTVKNPLAYGVCCTGPDAGV